MKVCECFVLVLEHFLAAGEDVIIVVGTYDCSTDRNSSLDPVICDLSGADGSVIVQHLVC